MAAGSASAAGRHLHCGPMRLAQILFSQGFGTRRVCAGLVESGAVRIGGQVVDDPGLELAPDGLVLEVPAG